MNRWMILLVTTCVLAALIALSGCATLQRATGHASGDQSTRHDAAPAASGSSGQESQREQLNDGYSSLYGQASGLGKVKDILYVKFEADDVQHVVDDVSDYNAQLADRLQSLTTQFPALDIHRDITPPILQAAKEAQKKGTLKLFEPVEGESGKVFERGLLIRLLGGLDQQRYLAQVLSAQEPDPALKQIMANVAKRYAQLFDEINALLIKRFYS